MSLRFVQPPNPALATERTRWQIGHGGVDRIRLVEIDARGRRVNRVIEMLEHHHAQHEEDESQKHGENALNDETFLHV